MVRTKKQPRETRIAPSSCVRAPAPDCSACRFRRVNRNETRLIRPQNTRQINGLVRGARSFDNQATADRSLPIEARCRQRVMHKQHSRLPVGGSVFTGSRSCGIFSCPRVARGRPSVAMLSAESNGHAVVIMRLSNFANSPVQRSSMHGMPIAHNRPLQSNPR